MHFVCCILHLNHPCLQCSHVQSSKTHVLSCDCPHSLVSESALFHGAVMVSMKAFAQKNCFPPYGTVSVFERFY